MTHFSENIEAHVESLVDIMENIPYKGVSVLTGGNGVGKSLIRTQIIFKFAERLGVEPKSLAHKVGSISMQKRTESNADWGPLSGVLHDTAWIPTSLNTFSLIENLFTTKHDFIIFDEPEIGMGEELVMSLVDYFNEKFKEFPDKGILIITHNRYMVENLQFDNFFNCDCIKTKEDWLNRKLVKADLEILKENKLFYHIRDKNKK